MTNRALVLAALATGTSRLHNPLRSRDSELMIGALRALGMSIESDDRDDNSTLVVTAQPLRAPDTVIDVGNAGTVARFVPPVAALAPGPVRLDGDPRMRERPLAPMLDALRRLGVRIDASMSGGLPLTVYGAAEVRGGSVEVDASTSSQFVSGLLLAAPRYTDGLALRHVGAPVPSAPHLDMTVAMLRTAGAEVRAVGTDAWHVQSGELQAREWQVEPDLSSAAPFLAAAVVTGGAVRVPDWPVRTTQPGARLPELLSAMGAHIDFDGTSLVIAGPDRIAGVTADLHDCGELTPVIAAVAALADSPSRLSGIAHLRRHETDRLAALATEINALGGDVRELDDGLVIEPRPLHGGAFATYDDHRIAMAGAVLGLVVSDDVLDDVATTGKTLPEFTELWDGMLAGDGR
jgi:3-phosphoshikimate 1-carboxyvinyltransferase